MPSRKEIAQWLREAEAALHDYEVFLQGTGRLFASHEIQCLHEDFAERAKQVENMRCETCERYVPGEDDEACTFNQIEYQGPGFGCWFHKSKEDNK